MIRNRDIFWSRVARFSICPLFGHVWGRKISGSVCQRCSIYREA